MKRLMLGSIFLSVGACVACAAEAPAPVDNTTGGTAPTGGTGGTGQAGTTTSSGAGVGGTTGGSSAVGGTGGTGAAGGAAPMAGSGATLMGGSGGVPTGGTAGGAAASAGKGNAGAGGASGSGTGGSSGVGAGGSSGAGIGGMGGSGGMGMAGAAVGGMGGMNGSGGSGEDLMSVAATLNGQTILMPCDQDTSTRVCTPRADTTKPCTGTGPSYAGTHSFNEQLTLGGEPGVRYLVTLHIRGLTEAKSYTGGTDRSSSGTQVPADGLYTGGQANNSGDGYNIYFIRTDSPSQYYYLNSIGVGNDNRIRHSVFESDYQFDMAVDGGSTVCLVSADPNTSAIKNCEEPDVSNVCNGVSLSNVDASINADIGNKQPYNGQFVGISVVKVTRM